MKTKIFRKDQVVFKEGDKPKDDKTSKENSKFTSKSS